MWILSGLASGISERPLSSWVAFFDESTEETRCRLGTEEVRGLHLSVCVVSRIERMLPLCTATKVIKSKRQNDKPHLSLNWLSHV